MGDISFDDVFFRTDDKVGASNFFTIETQKKNHFLSIQFILIPSSFVHVSPSSRTVCSVGDNSFVSLLVIPVVVDSLVSLNTLGFSIEGRFVRSKRSVNCGCRSKYCFESNEIGGLNFRF
jgi:hypothetical protein